ncbi:putative DNA repair-related protein [Mesomycoplasma conjunctivae]|uniref:Nucleoid-associated protein MCJ_003830 n=1 Tax=Mesomycoplasma conjunctivae (strain ATCC 25834 / NCTC 10147 / HRC/581) TaxID=572263 RepID=C5J6H9_MESCH|nr:YbaB/EbfC family nucleoid-associated protein [Mesomycoplasma conjunctivae]CAT05071.1 UPF0133 protein MYPU_0500 [Mesomycoplasma conjunctivae]VEU66272.1 putative DNA repair-related protein [Mesomycoplasma conjunctivae]
MNMQDLLNQARKMQKEIDNKKNNLKNTDFTFEKQGISLVISGGYEVKKISIHPVLADPEDIETLEDLILITLNEALEKINQENEKIMPNQSGM